MAATAFDEFYPYDTQSAAEAQWREMFRVGALGDGVAAGKDNELEPTAGSGRTTRIDTGRGWFAGQFGKILSQKTLNHAVNSSGQPRIDRVIARNNFTANQVELDVLTGTPGATPSPPALTSSGSVQEFSLAQVGPLPSGYLNTAGLVVDERMLLSPYGASAANASARDLWLPAPAEGVQVFTRDTNGLFLWTGSGWDQQRRKTDPIDYNPPGNQDSPAVAGTWPTGLTIASDVPPWATRAHLRAKIGQALAAGAAPIDVAVTLRFGATAVDPARLQWAPGVVGTDGRQDLMLEGDIDCSASAGTTVTVRTVAQIQTGTAVARVTAFSTCSLVIEYR